MLRPRKRISKREIKEDALVTAYFRVQKFIQRHTKQLNIGVTVVIIVIIAGVFIFRSKKKAELVAAGKLGIAEQFYYAAEYTKAIEDLTQIVNTYSGTKSAGTAAFLLANSYFQTGDYNNAQKYYEIYIDDYSDNELFSPSSLAGIAACLESNGQYGEAARLYEKAGKKYPDSFGAPMYLKDAGKCYVLAGDKNKGKEIYHYIIERYPQSSIRQEVSFLSEYL
ncbi:MAG: tol-pal system YbgF family protein [Candidatus Hodarchaeota archaeon]